MKIAAMVFLLTAPLIAPVIAHAAPADAPAGCVDPVGADGAPARVSRGAQVVGTYQLVPDKPLDTPHVRLTVHDVFVPERVGSTRGEHSIGLTAQLLPDAVRDGVSAANTVDLNDLSTALLGTYRIAIRADGKTGYRATIEDLGCPERAVHPPLALHEQKTFWVSTEGVKTYAFSTGDWYDDDYQVMAALTADLDPEVQQTAGTPPHGWMRLQGWETGPTSADLDQTTLRAGAVIKLADHRLVVKKVVLGPNTSIVDGRVITTGGPPMVSVLVEITRTAVR